MKTNTLKNLTALVTGAGRGIGRAMALALAEAGVRVLVTGRTAETLADLAQEINGSGGCCDFAVADLADPQVPAQLVEKTVARFAQLDILINNAGILPPAPVSEISIADWDRVMAVNARAPFLLCQAALPHLRRSRRGSIIQISSVAGERGYPNQGAYTASKHALVGFSKVLAQEVRPDGIRVHTILPGGVDTDMTAGINTGMAADELMRADEIADMVMFLLTRRGNAMIDAVRIRRSTGDPWF